MRGRYIEGLKDKPKSGRRSQINEKTEYRIKTILKQGNQKDGPQQAG